MKYTLTFLSILLTMATTYGQKLKPTSTNDFMMECMKTNGEDVNKQMALWIPYNFWEIIGGQMKASPEFVQNIITRMKDYTMFCIVDYTTSSAGISFKSDEEIRKTIKLVDSSKTILKPLDDKEISTDAKELIRHLEPMMAKMLGQFGGGMKIFLFKAKKANGEPVINVSTKNKFTLSWNSTDLSWKLPFSSVLPPKRCPVDNEQMKGNWNFCPEHGTPLNG